MLHTSLKILKYLEARMSFKNNCIGTINNDLKDKLKLPDDMNDIHLCWFKDNYYLIRINIKTPDEIGIFLKHWSHKSNMIWRVNKTDPKKKSAGLRNLYWKEFRCQHGNTKVSKKAKKIHLKHTNCGAKMTITIKRVPLRCRSTDIHLPNYPTIIKININHNHEIKYSEYLKQKSIPTNVREKFIRMFEAGHSPVSALKLHKIELQAEYGDSHLMAFIDRSKCPNVYWCYRLYASIYKDTSNSCIIRANDDSDDENEIESIEEIIVEDVDEKIEDSNNSILSPNDYDYETAIDELGIFVDQISKKLKTSSMTLLPALKTFNKTWQSFKSDSELIHALNTFGKNEVYQVITHF